MPASVNAMAQAVPIVLSRPDVHTVTYTETGVDLQDYEGVALAVLTWGPFTGTTPTFDGKLQHCDTVGGTYVDVPGAVFAQVTTATGIQAIAIDIGGICKRFVRFTSTMAGTTPNIVAGVSLTGMKKYR